MRHSKDFNKLLLQYEATSIAKRSKIFKKMRRQARTFADWAIIYQYAGSSIREATLPKMEAKVLKGKKLSDIQLNILEYFMVCYQNEKNDILRKYIKKYNSKDDLLFAFSVATSCWDNGDFNSILLDKLNKFYKRGGDIERGVKARGKKNQKLLEKSKFNP